MGKISSTIVNFALFLVGCSATSLLTIESALAQQAESMNASARFNAIIEDTGQFINQGIPFLNWDQSDLQVEVVGDLMKTVLIGHVDHPVKQIFFNGKEIQANEQGDFELSHEFKMETRTFNMRIVDADTKSYFGQYRIRAADIKDEKAAKSLFRFNFGAGITSLSYRQQRIEPFSQLALTIKGGAVYPIWKNQLDAGFSGFYNVIGFGSSSPRGYKMRYMGLNGRLGYSVIKAPSKLKMNINVGIYYNTSYSDIGFGNMMGPQLYPEISYHFDNGHSLHAYGKLSPAFSNDYSISFNDNREIAAGVHYAFPLNAVNRLSIGIDISQLKLSVEPNWGVTNTYSLSGGISF
jgi:hypothetical protein